MRIDARRRIEGMKSLRRERRRNGVDDVKERQRWGWRQIVKMEDGANWKMREERGRAKGRGRERKREEEERDASSR